LRRVWFVVTEATERRQEAVPVNGDPALWQSVADNLRDEISSGRLKPGDPVPTEDALREEWDLSRTTIRRALMQLIAEGLITEGRGRQGRQVADRRPLLFDAVRSESRAHLAERRGLGTDAYVTSAHEQGHSAGQDLRVAVEDDPGMAMRLGRPAGESVIVRRRVRYLDGRPNDLNDTFYPWDIAHGTLIEQPADVAIGTIALMEEMGYVQVRYTDEVEARMPSPDETRELRMPAGVPLLIQIRTGYTAERPVKVTVTRWRADRVRIFWEFGG
jgi:GntR family transcriptional regulator